MSKGNRYPAHILVRLREFRSCLTGRTLFVAELKDLRLVNQAKTPDSIHLTAIGNRCCLEDAFLQAFLLSSESPLDDTENDGGGIAFGGPSLVRVNIYLTHTNKRRILFP
jgi:hypothetical protein